MWSSDRRTFLIGLAAVPAVAGCGFSPAYAPGGAGSKLYGNIVADEPRDRDDYAFAYRIENRLGRNLAARYHLGYRIETDSDRLAITPDQETLRYHLKGSVDYRVTDSVTGKVVTSGRAENFTSYSAIGTTVATRASETNATERLIVILADKVVTQMLATAGGWAE